MGLSVTVLYFRQTAAGVQHSSSIVTDGYADLPLLRLHRAHNLFRPPAELNEPFELLKIDVSNMAKVFMSGCVSQDPSARVEERNHNHESGS